jgi:hypothetical protein
MDKPNIMPRVLVPDNLATIRDYPHRESGVLPPSILYIHMPSRFAQDALFYAPHIGSFFCNENYLIQRNKYDYYICLLVEN